MSFPSTSARAVVVPLVFAVVAGVSQGAEMVVHLPNGVEGTLALPEGGASGPAVVMLHGFGSSRDEVGGLFAMQAEALAAEGIASLRIDFRGYGESTGDMADTTIEGLVADAAAARGYLAEVDGVDDGRIGVIGYSFGAAVAMLEPDEFASVVVWGKMGNLQSEFHEFLGQDFYDKAKADGIASLDLGWRVISLKQEFLDSVARHDLAESFSGYPGPFLTIAGESDPASGYFDQYLSLATGKTEALVIPGADHMLGVFSDEPEIGRQVIDKTTAWLEETL